MRINEEKLRQFLADSGLVSKSDYDKAMREADDRAGRAFANCGPHLFALPKDRHHTRGAGATDVVGQCVLYPVDLPALGFAAQLEH